MSTPVAPEVSIAAALEAGLKTIDGNIPTAVENVTLKPPPAADAPYQEVIFVFASAGYVEKGGSTFLQTGYMQVTLKFPGGNGKGAAWSRARAIRSLFNVKASFTAGGVTTNISETPSMLPGFNDDEGRYVLAVRVFFQAEIPN